MRVNIRKVKDLIEEKVVEGVEKGEAVDVTAKKIYKQIEELVRFVELYSNSKAGTMAKLDMLITSQMLWSARTFGNRFTRTGKAPASHLKEEAKELFDRPDDLSEGADVFLLLLDWLWREGFTFHDLLYCATQKQKENEKWEWRQVNKHGKFKRTRRLDDEEVNKLFGTK